MKNPNHLLRLSLLAVISTILFSSCSQESLAEKITNNWVSGDTQSQYLNLKSNGSFSTNLFAEDLTGYYLLLDSTLQLDIPNQNISHHADSISVAYNEIGKAEVYYYENNEWIGTYKVDQFTSPSESKSFRLESVSDDELQLKGDNGLVFTFHPVVKESLASSFSIMSILRGLLGIGALLAFAFILSSDRKRINWRLVGIGMAMQIVLALLVLKVPFVKSIFDVISKGFVSVLNFTKDGSAFLFGDLINVDANGFIFAFQILPTIVFFAALTSALYYLGIIQWIVFAFAWLMSKTMHLSGAESLAAAGNIFLGQTESPLLVRPYLEKMTKSEIMCLMTGGMATIAGGVLGAYVGYLGGDSIQEQQIFASHLLAASIMSAPAAIVAAKMLVPESQPELIDRELNISKEKIGSNILDAISTGTRDGLKLAVNVGVMLLVFTAFMYMFNAFSFQIGTWLGLNESIIAFTDGRFEGLSLQFVLGMLFSPIAWLLGVDWQDAVLVGQLLGEKTILNEFFAYASLGKLKAAEMFINQKSIIIATYALCGFANFASIGIQIGGIGALAANQQSTLAKLGIKALIGGTIACFLTATIAGMLF